MKFFANAGKAIVRVASKAGFILKKYSPEILVGTGVAVMATGAFVACKQTEKAGDVIHDYSVAKRDIMDEASTDPALDAKQLIAKAKMQTAWRLVKVYAPVVGLEALGATCILSGFGIVKKRHAATLAAYEALDTKFREYREHAKKLLGEDGEARLANDIQDATIETVDEDGKVVDSMQGCVVGAQYSPYARCFDERNVYWKKDPVANRHFLECDVQAYANDYLRRHGHLFLNQVYEWLGFEHTPEGALVGWLSEHEGGKDGYVDLGLMEVWKSKVADFQHGYERSIILDFNVDGEIWDKI